MSPVRLFSGNRPEVLLDVLAEVFRHDPDPDPLRPETVVVPSRAVARWAAAGLAQRLGVWANARYPFPGALVADLAGGLSPGGGPPLLGREALVWRLVEVLPEAAGREGFGEVARYLEGDDDGRRCLALARRLAAAFERYALYRPELVLGWSRGRGRGWQARLWRLALGEPPADHWAARYLALVEALDGGAPGPWPRRVTFFGFTLLPRPVLDLVPRLGRVSEVLLFVPNPSRQFWTDLVSERERLRRVRRSGAAGPELHYEEGHPLLASWGRAARPFFDALVELPAAETECFAAPDGAGMLARLQGDILDLRERRGADRVRVPRADRSIQVHACHGPMREMEALYENLLAVFEAHPEIQPWDVLVMAPDITAYAPYIDAVFGARRRGGEIPYAVSGGGGPGRGGVAGALLRLLA
ncbi:exodeoxyribonuclease V subunit gamma, partial [Dissulfurirhabdus thermomarina]